MSTTLKGMVLLIFLSICGCFIGAAGLIAHWPVAKMIGIASLVVLAAIFWLSLEMKTETLDRLLSGDKDRSET